MVRVVLTANAAHVETIPIEINECVPEVYQLTSLPVDELTTYAYYCQRERLQVMLLTVNGDSKMGTQK